MRLIKTFLSALYLDQNDTKLSSLEIHKTEIIPCAQKCLTFLFKDKVSAVLKTTPAGWNSPKNSHQKSPPSMNFSSGLLQPTSIRKGTGRNLPERRKKTIVTSKVTKPLSFLKVSVQLQQHHSNMEGKAHTARVEEFKYKCPD